MLWKERFLILAHLPDLVTTFLHEEVAHLQQNNLVSTEWHCGQWEIFFGLSSGVTECRAGWCRGAAGGE